MRPLGKKYGFNGSSEYVNFVKPFLDLCGYDVSVASNDIKVKFNGDTIGVVDGDQLKLDLTTEEGQRLERLIQMGYRSFVKRIS